MTAVLAPYTGKSVVEDAAIKVAKDDLLHIGAEEPVLLREDLIMELFQPFKVILNALLVLRFLRLSGSIYAWHRLSLRVRNKGKLGEILMLTCSPF